MIILWIVLVVVLLTAALVALDRVQLVQRVHRPPERLASHGGCIARRRRDPRSRRRRSTSFLRGSAPGPRDGSRDLQDRSRCP